VNQSGVTDVVGLFVFFSTIMFGREAAAIIGPYVVIVVTAAVGASFSLIRREKATRTNAVFFFLRVCGLATMVTVGLSALLAGAHPSLTERALLAPIAFLIGLVGDNWPEVIGWFARRSGRLLDVLVRMRGSDR
jgi:uncharacterized membrane protein YiaA